MIWFFIIFHILSLLISTVETSTILTVLLYISDTFNYHPTLTVPFYPFNGPINQIPLIATNPSWFLPEDENETLATTSFGPPPPTLYKSVNLLLLVSFPEPSFCTPSNPQGGVFLTLYTPHTHPRVSALLESYHSLNRLFFCLISGHHT